MGRTKLTWGVVLVACLGAFALGAAPAGATFAGANGQIATAWLDDDQGAHFESGSAIVNVSWRTGSSLKNVASCTGTDNPCTVFAHVAYSPDGTQLVYDEQQQSVSDAPNPLSVLVLKGPGGSAPVTIADTAKTQNYFEPSFLPSGKRIVFVRSATVGPQSDPPPHGQIVTSDLTGGNIRVVTSLLGADPVVSPSGRKVLFDHRGGIWVVGVNGGTAHELIRTGGFPDFSPDGRSIAYLSGGKQILYVARADGTHARQVLGTYPGQKKRHALQYANYPRFSPDGTEIAFSPAYYNVEGDPSLARVPVGGGSAKVVWTSPPLDAGGTDFGIAWQPLPRSG
jgi:dipeptidyl aminopeptidase/acylaminoacyl peptidase